MADNIDIDWMARSDDFFLAIIGAFVKHHRLTQNKTQESLAEAAGINRATLRELERGGRSNTLTLIQVLRVLGQLETLSAFEVQQKISPLLLAEMEKNERKRASGSKGNRSQPDW